mgnify:CR=1 FL=1
MLTSMTIQPRAGYLFSFMLISTGPLDLNQLQGACAYLFQSADPVSLYHAQKSQYKYVLKCLEVFSLINVKRRLLMISLHCTIPCDVLVCCVYQTDRIGQAYRQLLSHVPEIDNDCINMYPVTAPIIQYFE